MYGHVTVALGPKIRIRPKVRAGFRITHLHSHLQILPPSYPICSTLGQRLLRPKMSTRSAESRDNSPENDADAPEKRASKKRKVLSCYACRNRKMKCDRICMWPGN